MDNYTTAVHVIRGYFQDRLQAHLPDYWGSKPPAIIPAQQQPEQVEGEVPFLVYIGSFGPTSDLFQYQTEVMNCSVYSTSPARIAAVTKLAFNLFNRFDISADRVNDWIAKRGDINGQPHPFKQFEFKTIYVTGAIGAQPASGGDAMRNDGELEITMEYVDVLDEFADDDLTAAERTAG